jgi:hypothetical protein
VRSAAVATLRGFTSALLLRWLLFVAIFSLAVVPPVDPDLWWHLANGRLITTTATLPHTDVYSFTAIGHLWVMHEWLTDLAMYGLYRAGGLPLLVATFALVVTAAAIGLYLVLRWTGLHSTACVLLTLIGTLAGSTAWGARPQLLNVLFTGVLVLGLIAYREGRLRALALPPFIWLWANLHSGFLVGLIISGLFLAGEAIDRWRSSRSAMPRRRLVALGWAIVAATALSLVNPSGIQTLLFPLGTLTSPLIQNNIQEWASPDFHSMAGGLFEAIVFLILGGLATGRVRARTHEWLWGFSLLYLALASQRNVPLFVLAAAPLTGRCVLALLAQAASILPSVPRRPTAQAAFRWAPMVPAAPTVVAGALNLWLLLVVASGMIWYRAVPNLRPADQAMAIASTFPVHAADALDAIHKPVRIFNYYDYGGYLLWRLYPGGSRVFIDGRVEVYGSVVFTRYLQVNYLGAGWPDVLQQYQPDAIVLPTAHPLVTLLREDPGWHVLASDGVATVLTRVGFTP